MAGNGKVFVSHAHADNVICDHYVQALRARGLDVWYDRQDMQAGQALTDVIERELQARSNFVVILTPTSISSYWVQMEIAAFRDLASRDSSRLILPVRVGNGEVPLLLRGLKWVDAAQIGFDPAIEEIVTALHGAPAASSVSASATPPWSNLLAHLFGKSAPPSAPKTTTLQKTLIVDANGNGNYRTISEAITAAPFGASIIVRPGTYRESLKIAWPVEIRGDGPREGIVIETNTEDETIWIRAQDRVRLANLTIRHANDDTSDDTRSAILIGGKQVEIENCHITANNNSAVISIAGDEQDVSVRNCHIQSDARGDGVEIIGPQARLTLEDNEIVGAGDSSGISVVGGVAIARRNRISKFDEAIWIQLGGGGIFKNNDLRGNDSPWAILPDAGKVVRSENKE